MNRRTRFRCLLRAALAASLLLAQAASGQTLQSRRPPGTEPELPPPPRPGRPHVRLRAAPAGEVFALAFSPDGLTLAVCTTNRAVNLWSAETGELLKRLPAAGGPVTRLLWSPDGRGLAAYSGGRRAFYFWDVGAGELRAVSGAHRREVETMGWAAGHAALLTLDADKWLRAWEAATGRLIYERRLKGLKSLSYSPGGEFVLALREYERPELLDPLTGEKRAEVGTERLNPHLRAPLAHFAPGGRRLFFRDGSKRFVLWDAETGRESALASTQGKHDDFLAAEFSPDGRMLALVRRPHAWSLDISNEVQVYDLGAGALRATLRLKGFGNISKVVWGEDGKTVAAVGTFDPKRFASGHRAAVTWRVGDGAAYASFPLAEARAAFMGTLPETAETAELLARGRVLLTYDRESVKFWDARTGERLFGRAQGHVSVGRGGRFVATAGGGAARAHVWEAVAP